MPNTVSVVHGAWRLPGPGGRAATIRFSRTVRLLKMRRPCGTSAMPRAAIASGGRRVMSAPNTSTRAAARRQQADHDIHAGRLAGAVAAEQPEQAAFAERERHLLEDVAVPVEGVDVVGG